MQRSILTFGLIAVALAAASCAPGASQAPEAPSAVAPAPAAAVAVPPVAFNVQALADFRYLYPDMKAVPPGNLWIEKSNTTRRLHFSNTIQNYGPGHLQVRGRLVNGQTEAIQEIIDDRGAVKATKSVGFFAYHSSHNHFHIDQVSRYRLVRYSPTGTVVREASKVSFCLMDSYVSRYPAPSSRYKACSNTVQGITRNWQDVYTSNLPGQNLDVTGLSAGEYYLTTTADPASRFVDYNRGNNVAWVKIYLDPRAGNFRILARSS